MYNINTKGDSAMATESIQMNVIINDEKSASNLASALEQATDASESNEQAVVTFAYASGEEIRSMFSSVSQ